MSEPESESKTGSIEGPGADTARLVDSVFKRGVSRAVLLMRHSAREYVAGRHDLENPLTEEGRRLASNLGGRLPKGLTVRGYASPPERCMETAELVLAGHEALGGAVTRHRPLEALGVFYALDQIKMWQGMRAAGGLVPYMQTWLDGTVPVDALMDPLVASRMILAVMAEKLQAPIADCQLDVCVSHDMTLYLIRACLLGASLTSSQVAYLDGVVLFEQEEELRLAGLGGLEVTVSESHA